MHVNEGRNFLEIEKQKVLSFKTSVWKKVYARCFERENPKFGLKLWRRLGPRVFSKQLWYGLEKKELIWKQVEGENDNEKNSWYLSNHRYVSSLENISKRLKLKVEVVV